MSLLNTVCGAAVAGYGPLPVSEGDSTFKPSGKKREHVPGCNANDGGHTSANTPAELELSLNATKTLTIQNLGLIEAETITVKMTTGEVHYMKSAFCEEQPSYGSDGKIKVKFLSNISVQG